MSSLFKMNESGLEMDPVISHFRLRTGVSRYVLRVIENQGADRSDFCNSTAMWFWGNFQLPFSTSNFHEVAEFWLSLGSREQAVKSSFDDL